MIDTRNHFRVLILAAIMLLTALTTHARAGDLIDIISDQQVFVRHSRPSNVLIFDESTLRGAADVLRKSGVVLHGASFCTEASFTLVPASYLWAWVGIPCGHPLFVFKERQLQAS